MASKLEWSNVTIGDFSSDAKANKRLMQLWTAIEDAKAEFEAEYTAHAVARGAIIEGEGYAFAYRHGGLGVAQRSATTGRKSLKL